MGWLQREIFLILHTWDPSDLYNLGKSGYLTCENISQSWEKYLPRAIRYYPTNRIFALDRADNIDIQYNCKHLRQVDLWGKGPNDLYRSQMCKLPIFLT